MRRLIDAWFPSLIGKFLFSFALISSIIYGAMLYGPVIDYWKFKLGKNDIILGKSINLRLKNGWYPIAISSDAIKTHVVVVKINPLLPGKTYISKLDFIYKPDFKKIDFSNKSVWIESKFSWGSAMVYNKKNIAFIDNGKLSVYFNDLSDLAEIDQLKIDR